MKNKNLVSRGIFLFTFLLSIGGSFAQNNAEQTQIINYLESTINCNNNLIISSTSQSVLASDIIESSLTYSTGDSYSYGTIEEQYFIKSGNKLTSFNGQNEMLASSEFIESIKSKKFKLNTEDDGVAFQSMLKLMDDQKGLGFFKEENIWYFIRSEFFDDIEAFVVTTDKKGQILMVVYENELKKPLAETLLRSGENIKNNDSETALISKKDSAFMHNSLLAEIDYIFEISPLNFYSINKISSISINKCTLKVTKRGEGRDMRSISSYSCMLVSNDNEYIKQSSADGLIEMPLFINSLQEKYTLNTDDDARLFQYILDDLAPVSRYDIELKTFYKKDNMWFFVREKSFDDLKGYILVLDDKNKVSYVEYTTISEESILRIKMKNPNYKVDYQFKLIKPATNKVTVKQGEGLSVEISFDADMVNAKGCWIMTRFDGTDEGMYAGSSITSPYTDGITGMALENQYHTVEYFLLGNGETDIENALDAIKIEIEVE